MKRMLAGYGWRLNLTRLSLLASVGFLMGCASTPTTQPSPSSPVPPLPAGVTLHQDMNIPGVWLAEGFDFKGFDALYLAAPVFAAVERPNEVQMRAIAMRVLLEKLTVYLHGTKLFATVTTRAEEVKPSSKSLKLESTITEYEEGSGAGRYFVGVFGGGQPVIKVRGRILDGEKLVCVFEIRRSGESAEAKVAGGAMIDEDIQREDITVLARDVANFFRRTAQAP